MKKRLLSILLCAAMLFTLLPAVLPGASAASSEVFDVYVTAGIECNAKLPVSDFADMSWYSGSVPTGLTWSYTTENGQRYLILGGTFLHYYAGANPGDVVPVTYSKKVFKNEEYITEYVTVNYHIVDKISNIDVSVYAPVVGQKLRTEVIYATTEQGELVEYDNSIVWYKKTLLSSSWTQISDPENVTVGSISQYKAEISIPAKANCVFDQAVTATVNGEPASNNGSVYWLDGYANVERVWYPGYSATETATTKTVYASVDWGFSWTWNLTAEGESYVKAFESGAVQLPEGVTWSWNESAQELKISGTPRKSESNIAEFRFERHTGTGWTVGDYVKFYLNIYTGTIDKVNVTVAPPQVGEKLPASVAYVSSPENTKVTCGELYWYYRSSPSASWVDITNPASHTVKEGYEYAAQPWLYAADESVFASGCVFTVNGKPVSYTENGGPSDTYLNYYFPAAELASFELSVNPSYFTVGTGEAYVASVNYLNGAPTEYTWYVCDYDTDGQPHSMSTVKQHASVTVDPSGTSITIVPSDTWLNGKAVYCMVKTAAGFYYTDEAPIYVEQGYIPVITVNNLRNAALGLTPGDFTEPTVNGHCRILDYYWWNESYSSAGQVGKNTEFDSDGIYSCCVVVAPEEGYYFDENTIVMPGTGCSANVSLDMAYTKLENTGTFSVWTEETAAEKSIDEIGFYGAEGPFVGASAAAMTEKIIPYNSKQVEILEIGWYNENTYEYLEDTDLFNEDDSYSLMIYYKLCDGWYLPADMESYWIDNSRIFEVDAVNSGEYGPGTYVLWSLPVRANYLVNEINVEIAEPAVGQKPSFIPEFPCSPADGIAGVDVAWSEFDEETNLWKPMAVDDVFASGKRYAVNLQFVPADGFTISKDRTSAAINGCAVEIITDFWTSAGGPFPFGAGIEFPPLGVTQITRIDVTIPAPVPGEHPSTRPSAISDPANALEVGSFKLYWTEYDPVTGDDYPINHPDEYTFKADKSYQADFMGVCKADCCYANNIELYVNGVTGYMAHFASGAGAEFYVMKAFENKILSVVRADNISVPVAGTTALSNLEAIYFPEDANYTFVNAYWRSWTNGGAALTGGESFTAGDECSLRIILAPKTGCQFVKNPDVLLNGYQYPASATLLADGSLAIETFRMFVREPSKVDASKITNVSAEIPAPAAGQKPATEAKVTTTFEAALICTVNWLVGNTADFSKSRLLADGEVFHAGMYYWACIYVECPEGFRFGTASALVNGSKAADTYDTDGTGKVLGILQLFSTPACATWNYTDVPAESNWAHAGIDFCVNRGIMGSTKTDALTFEPKTTCTRSMIVSILYRLMGSPAVTYEAKFPDVKAGQWYSDAVIWAYQNGLVAGYDTGKFGPNDKITREQLAVILMNFTAKFGYYDENDSADLSGFADAKSVTWSKTAVQWAVACGIISGKAQNGKLYLDPKGNCTRQEAASVLMRFIGE